MRPRSWPVRPPSRLSACDPARTYGRSRRRAASTTLTATGRDRCTGQAVSNATTTTSVLIETGVSGLSASANGPTALGSATLMRYVIVSTGLPGTAPTATTSTGAVPGRATSSRRAAS